MHQRYPALLHHLNQSSVTQFVRDAPAKAQQDDLRKMPPFEVFRGVREGVHIGHFAGAGLICTNSIGIFSANSH